MPSVNLRGIDLNFLVVFRALAEERHVSRAAHVLGMSQPATSAALKRLRVAVGDPILVRKGSRLVLTPRAEQLQAGVRAALQLLETTLSGEPKLELQTSESLVRICATDYGAAVFLPDLLQRLAEQAPRLRLRVAPAREASMVESLRDGSFDLGVGAVRLARPSLHYHRLFRERPVCLVRKGHPAAKRASRNRMRKSDFHAYAHIRVSLYREADTIMDDLLREQKMPVSSQHVVAFTSLLPHLIENTDLIAMCGERIAESMCANSDTVILKPPVALGMVDISVVWPSAADQNPVVAWVRDQIIDAAS